MDDMKLPFELDFTGIKTEADETRDKVDLFIREFENGTLDTRDVDFIVLSRTEKVLKLLAFLKMANWGYFDTEGKFIFQPKIAKDLDKAEITLRNISPEFPQFLTDAFKNTITTIKPDSFKPRHPEELEEGPSELAEDTF